MAILEVFLVEPDDAERATLKALLEPNGYFVKAFASADAMLIHLIVVNGLKVARKRV